MRTIQKFIFLLFLFCFSLAAYDLTKAESQIDQSAAGTTLSRTIDDQSTRPEQPNSPLMLHWSDGESDYLSVLSQTTIEDPASLIENSDSLTLSKVDKIPPFFAEASGMVATYRILGTSVSIPLSVSEESTVYLFGESHIGESQIKVAKAFIQLLKEKEINAIMVEQPSDKELDWSNFRQLENNPDQAIANLQAEMLGAAANYESYSSKVKEIFKPIEELKSSERGKKWLPYLARISSQNDLQSVVEEVGLRYSKTELNDFLGFLEEISGRVEQISITDGQQSLSKLNQLQEDYQDSRYLSAADYLYLMLNLKGIKIPFHFVEDPGERDQYEAEYIKNPSRSTQATSETLLGRDRAMVRNIKKLITEYDYHQSALIIGAMHTENIKQLLAEEDDDFKLVVRSVVRYQEDISNLFKPEMATSKNPDYINQVAATPAEKPGSPEYIVENFPSEETVQKLTDSLSSEPFKFDSDEIQQIQDQFVDRYVEQGYCASPSWSLTLTHGKRTLLISEDGENKQFTVTELTELQEKISRYRSDFLKKSALTLYKDDDKDSANFFFCCVPSQKGTDPSVLAAKNNKVLLNALPLVPAIQQKKTQINAIGFSQAEMKALMRNVKQIQMDKIGARGESGEVAVLTSEVEAGGGGGRNGGGGGNSTTTMVSSNDAGKPRNNKIITSGNINRKDKAEMKLGDSRINNHNRTYFVSFIKRKLLGWQDNTGPCDVKVDYSSVNSQDTLKLDWSKAETTELKGDHDVGYRIVIPTARKSKFGFDVKGWFSQNSQKACEKLNTILEKFKNRKAKEDKGKLERIEEIADQLVKELRQKTGKSKIELIFKYFDPVYGMRYIKFTYGQS